MDENQDDLRAVSTALTTSRPLQWPKYSVPLSPKNQTSQPFLARVLVACHSDIDFSHCRSSPLAWLRALVAAQDEEVAAVVVVAAQALPVRVVVL
jgi:hypothetical protein